MNKSTVKSYQQALEFLNGKKERPYAHNTRIQADSLDLGHEAITIKYHGNPVVNFYPDHVSFNSCGWKSLTTKERINWFLPDGFTLYQNKYVWYIRHREGSEWIFADGITITNDGAVYGYASRGVVDNTKQTIKDIHRYVKGYVTALLEGKVKAPDNGDCWYCLMRTQDGKNLGEVTGNNHIKSHIENEYYVPSLLVNAEGHKNICPLARDGLARLWKGQILSAWQAYIVKRDVTSSLAAYLKHALNIAR